MKMIRLGLAAGFLALALVVGGCAAHAGFDVGSSEHPGVAQTSQNGNHG